MGSGKDIGGSEQGESGRADGPSSFTSLPLSDGQIPIPTVFDTLLPSFQLGFYGSKGGLFLYMISALGGGKPIGKSPKLNYRACLLKYQKKI